MALLRDLNMNDKLISKEDEKKGLKRKIKFIKMILNLYTMFKEKIAKLWQVGII